MIELMHEALAPVNVLFTGLLILVLFYWLSVIIGVLDIGAVDLDFDIDADLDIDVDADLDTDVDTGSSPGWFAGALHFFNFGKLPFMVVLTFLTLCLWSFSILSNYYIGQGSWLHAVMMFIPILFVSLIITKAITTPMIPMFKRLDAGIAAIDYIGLTCKILLPASTTQMGQAEVLIEDSPLLINVKTKAEEQSKISKGEEAVIIGASEGEDFYYIEATSI